MVEDIEEGTRILQKEALVINPEYLKLPEVPLEQRIIKEYMLYGDSDIVPFQELLNKDLLGAGLDEMCAYQLWYSAAEAVQNAQEHRYKWKKYDDEGNLNEIRVFCQFTPIYDIVSVQSKGNLDLTHIRELLEQNKELRFGHRGRGFYIMTKFCDVVYPHRNKDEEYLDIILIKMKQGDVIIHGDNTKGTDSVDSVDGPGTLDILRKII